MSKITKVLALMLVAIFALSLVACGGDEGDNNTTTKAQTTAGETSANEVVSTSEGETTTTVAGETTAKDNKQQKEEKTTTKKTTENKNLVDNAKGVSKTGALIPRTTNKAGNASAKFIKSLKGFELKILYPWENIYGDKKCKASAEASIKEVENLYGVKITESGKFSKYNELLASELSAKKCENDLYYAQNSFFASYFQKGYIADLTTAMRESGVDFNDPWYISDAKGFLNIDGKQYGWIPYEDEYTTPYCIIYNKKLLNKKKLADPAKLAAEGKWDWETLQKYAKKFDNDKNVTGFCASYTDMLFETIAYQYGTKLTKVSRGSQPTTNITDAKVKSALTEISNWCVGKKAWAETFSGQAWNYPKNQLAEGKVAMYFGNHDAIQNLAGSSYKNDMGIAPFPNKKGSKSYTNISVPQFIAFVPIVNQNDASKILFIRNEYYRYNYRYVNRNFQYKWSNYLGDDEAITNAGNIKFGKNGNKIVFSWTSICEDSSAGITTSTILSEVLSGKSTPAQAISSKKNALTKTYADVWKGHTITGNV
ncbi:MAG: ABC transporter substrate-binding protein [Acutalibacteraceae bacterium]